LQLLYLDSYYFYAPVPRVINLKHKLSQYNPRNYKLLYGGFSRPQYFMRQLTQTIISGEAAASILSLYVRPRELKHSKAIKGFRDMLKDILSGKVDQKRLKLEKLARSIGDENASMIDFIVFLLQNSEPENKISKGYCNILDMKIDRETALALDDPVKIMKTLENFKRRHVSLYKLYEDYMLCKTCRILDLKYPYAVDYSIKEFKVSSTESLKALCNNCMDLCSDGHNDDIEKAEILLEYAETKPSVDIHIATVATLDQKKFQKECFSCLVKCMDEKVDNIVALK